MKKTLAIIGLAVLAGVTFAQNQVTILHQTQEFTTIIAPQNIQSFMANAKAPACLVSIDPTNGVFVVRGQMYLSQPLSTITNTITLPDGFDVTNIQSGATLTLTTNGLVLHGFLRK